MLLDTVPLVILLLATFFVAFFVAAIGPTGGLQLAATSSTVPATLVIPIHAWISGISALFRSIGLRGEINKRFVLRFILPSLVLTGLAVTLGERAGFGWIKLIIGIYIVLEATGLFARLGEMTSRLSAPPEICGAATGFITVFIGASGPLLWSLMQHRFERKEQLAATHATCLLVQHLSKIAMFGTAGIVIFDYWPLLLALTGCSLAGTFAGQHVLWRIREESYRNLLRIALLISGAVVVFIAASELGLFARLGQFNVTSG